MKFHWPTTKEERLLLLAILFCLFLNWFWLPPFDFPVDRVVVIKRGQTLSEIAETLKQEKVIRSAWLFKNVVARQGGDREIIADYYQFERRLSLPGVVSRLLAGESTIEPVKLTFPEGLTNETIARILSRSNLVEFKKEDFLAKAASLQGLLFPSTYFVPNHITSDQIIALMYDNFSRQIAPLESAIKDSGRTLEEVVKMASIVEREASKPDDRRAIADILWRRYDEGLRLQVDVATSTYAMAGLPLTPIANPSFDSIKAVLEPIPTANWFYLSDSSGVTHYARTYTEHKKNIAKYLK